MNGFLEKIIDLLKKNKIITIIVFISTVISGISTLAGWIGWDVFFIIAYAIGLIIYFYFVIKEIVTNWKKYLGFLKKFKRKIIAGLLVVLCLICIGFVWDYYRLKKEYYADYVDKWGVPEGVIKLNKSQVKKRQHHYRFESSQQKLRRVVYANSAGTPIDHVNTEYTDRPSILELKYSDNRLIITELKNAKNNTIVAYFWGGENYDCIDIKRDKFGGESASLTASFTSISSNLFIEVGGTKAYITRFKLTRNESGYITCKEFKQYNGEDFFCVSDANGILGTAYHLDSLGRIIQICYLGTNKCHGMPNRLGVAKRKYEYDQYGNISKVEYLDTDYNPILNEQHWAICRNFSNENGNVTLTSYYGTDSLLCFNIYGFAVLESEYNKRGFEIKRTFFDTDIKPCLSKDRVAGWSSEYDKKGYEIKKSYLGTDSLPGIDWNNVSGYRSKYDENGNLTEKSYFGKNGQFCYHAYGNAIFRLGYNERGNKTEQSYWFSDNERLCQSKVAIEKFKYDERGNCVETSFYDCNEKPCVDEDGDTKWTSEYDIIGNVIENIFFGLDTIFDADGIERTKSYPHLKKRYVYNANGFCVETAFFDRDDNPIFNIDSVAGWWSFYDEKGNELTRTFFDTERKPCLNKYKVAIMSKKYDDRGNIIIHSCYDTNGKLCFNIHRIAGAIYEYDERGNVTKETYFDTEGKPSFSKYEIAGFKYEYDKRGNVTKKTYIDTEEKTYFYKDVGYAIMEIEYDERDNPRITIEYNAHGERIRSY